MRIQTLRTATLILAMLAFSVAIVQFSVRAMATPPPAASSQSHILVRILELTGTGPDEAVHSLYASKDGYTTTLNALGRIGSQVHADGLKDGAYHTLYVRLDDRYEILRADGSRQIGSFSQQEKPTRVRVRGMIIVEKGKASALHMQEHPNYYSSPGNSYGHDEDD